MRELIIAREIRFRSNAGRSDRAGDSKSLECEREIARLNLTLGSDITLGSDLTLASYVAIGSDLTLGSNLGGIFTHSNALRSDRAVDSDSFECGRERSRGRFEFARLRRQKIAQEIRMREGDP